MEQREVMEGRGLTKDPDPRVIGKAAKEKGVQDVVVGCVGCVFGAGSSKQEPLVLCSVS